MEANAKYDITCPYCNYKMQAMPSIFHRMGVPYGGSGSCKNCGKEFCLVVVPRLSKMIAITEEKRRLIIDKSLKKEEKGVE